jgi:hypothetical protein
MKDFEEIKAAYTRRVCELAVWFDLLEQYRDMVRRRKYVGIANYMHNHANPLLLEPTSAHFDRDLDELRAPFVERFEVYVRDAALAVANGHMLDAAYSLGQSHMLLSKYGLEHLEQLKLSPEILLFELERLCAHVLCTGRE